MTFSMDAPECRICEYYDDCKHKRKVACAVYPEQNLALCVSESVTIPLAADMAVKHDYRTIKVGENTHVTIDLENIKKKLTEEIYRGINGCFFSGA